MGTSVPLSTKRRFKLFAAGICVFVLLVWLLGGLGERRMAPRGESNSISQIEAADIDVNCDNMKESLERDVCYWNKFIEEWRLNGMRLEGIHIRYCYQMNNAYMQYICLRGDVRPHMMPFISQSNTSITSPEISEAVGGCLMQEGHINRFCILTYVASLANSNRSEAQRICNSLKDTLLRGECIFYIAVAGVMDLKSSNIDEEITSLMELCSTIDDADWRAECYYILADELALLRPVAHLGEIVEACRKSVEAADFGCYDHVVMLLPFEEASTYCGLLEDYERRSACVWGIGRVIGSQSGGNITWAMEGCQKFSSLLFGHCLSGMANAIGAHSINISQGSIVCRDFPVELVESCIHGVSGAYAVPPYKVNASSAIEKCNEFPPEFQDFCFDYLIGAYLDFPEAVDLCEELPYRLKERCLERMHAEEDKE